MKILVAVLMSPNTPKIYGKVLMGIMRQEWDEQLDILFIKEDNPKEDHKYENIKNKHNRIRKTFLTGGYDYLFFVESDNVIPSDALKRLIACDTDVAYGLYVNRHGTHQWLAHYQLGEGGGTSFSLDPVKRDRVWRKQAETKGAGFGCTLIRKNVLKALKFRNHPKHEVSDDWMFSIDCQNKGFKQVHDFGLHVGHMNPDCTILWPTNDNKAGYYIEYPEGYEFEEVKEIRFGKGMTTIYKEVEK